MIPARFIAAPRHILHLCAIVTALFASVLGGRLALASSFDPNAGIAWAFIPWCLGVYGAIGLLDTWRDPGQKTQTRLRMDLLLLGLGLVAAGLFAAMLVGFTGLVRPPWWGWVLAVIALVVFPGIAVIAAALSIRSLRPHLAPVRAQHRFIGLAMLMLALPGAITAGHALVYDRVVAHFSGTLVADATQAAERLAGASRYCAILPGSNAVTLDQLDARAVVRKGLYYRHGLHLGNHYVDPHFGILTGGQAYWWSFRQRDFVAMPRYPWTPSLATLRRCAGAA